MNIWERLMRVFVKPEPVIEKKNDEVIVIKTPVRIAGTYRFYRDFLEENSWQYEGHVICIHIKAIAEVEVNGTKRRFIIDDNKILTDRFTYEYHAYIKFFQWMNETPESFNNTIQEEMLSMVREKIEAEKEKDLKEQFENFKKVEFDLELVLTDIKKK
ncbi:hypothetical protein [Bacillus phage vB_BanS-Thrax5]|nr:hypothetical protein [Bacillus phage vB_BanS-Thrax5]